MDEAPVWAKRDAAVVWHGFTQMSSYTESTPIVVDRADGHELIDVDGKRYLDAVSSLWVNTIGHRVPGLDDALREQIEHGAHSTMLGNGNRVVIELGEALAPLVPVDDPHFLFAGDGASAVEQALKIAFQYWANRGVDGRTTFLAFGGAYHGDTIGALSVGDGGFGTDLFDPLRFPVIRAPQFADPDCFVTAARMVAEHAHELAAVIVEPLVQAAAGMQIAPSGAFAVLGDACRDHDVLLICDEVATGFGRTGTLFASEQCGVRPDLMALGKGLTAGYLPQSATVASGRVFDAFLGPDLSEKTLYHGHSYGGNALACAVALRHLELIDALDVLANVRARSADLHRLLDARISSRPEVRDVRLHGLMCGVELAPPALDLKWDRRLGRPAPQEMEPAESTGMMGRRVCAAAVRNGVLLRPVGDVVVIMPPLTITTSELERIVETLEASLDEVCA
ncbi:MAG: adenosylmethionine--8-amino-7-oxononanoate transaminase [Acidimicrobiia bacterium]